MMDSPIDHPGLKRLPALSLLITEKHPIFQDLEEIMQAGDGLSRPWVLTLVPSVYDGVFATAHFERLGSPPYGILIYEIYDASQKGRPGVCRRIRRRLEKGRVYSTLPTRTNCPHRANVRKWLDDIVNDYDAKHPSPPQPSIFEGLEKEDG